MQSKEPAAPQEVAATAGNPADAKIPVRALDPGPSGAELFAQALGRLVAQVLAEEETHRTPADRS